MTVVCKQVGFPSKMFANTQVFSTIQTNKRKQE
jgi:hypothetical protein